MSYSHSREIPVGFLSPLRIALPWSSAGLLLWARAPQQHDVQQQMRAASRCQLAQEAEHRLGDDVVVVAVAAAAAAVGVYAAGLRRSCWRRSTYVSVSV